MRTEMGTPIQYYLPLGEDTLHMNEWIGKAVRLEATGTFHCVACAKTITKRYGQGFCYPCFVESPMNAECIVRPELCRAHVGEGRDPQWEEEHHNQPHVVYLANGGALKVGVTRTTQIPTRWIDQGTAQAIIIAMVPYRALAGQLEVALKDHVGDKTPWQRMLRSEFPLLDLVAERARLHKVVPKELQQYLTTHEQATALSFPILRKPIKLQSVNLEKTFTVEAVLEGIRGQYLLFDTGQVLNVRRYAGVEIRWSGGDPQPVQGSLF